MPFIYDNGIPRCKKPGVYAITNKRNGKCYVGSSICVSGRLDAHRRCLRRGAYGTHHLQRAWDRYGEEAFRFDVLETCEAGQVLVKEQYWIDNLNSADRRFGYNLCAVAGGGMKGLKHKAETKAHWSKIRKGIVPVAATAAAAEANRGRERPAEVREKIRAGNRGKKRSEDTKAKIKASHWSKRPDAAEIAKRTVMNRPQTLTPEHRAKIAEGGRRHWEAYRKKYLDKWAVERQALVDQPSPDSDS